MLVLNALQQRWTNNVVSRIELFYITTNTVTRVPISSTHLEAIYDCKLDVNYFSTNSPFGRLIAEFGDLKPRPSGKRADLRWGCAFYGKSGKRIAGIYFDRSGLNGVVEGCCVSFASDRLRKWAEENFARIFE